jgi:hypothetical protein
VQRSHSGCGPRSPGSGFSGLGASKGRETPWECGRGSGRLVVMLAAEADGNVVEVLEGARKARSGDEPYGKPHGRPPAGRRQGPRRKAQGRRWSREAERTATAGGQTLKVDATPRRVRLQGRRGKVTGPRTRNRTESDREAKPEAPRCGRVGGTDPGRERESTSVWTRERTGNPQPTDAELDTPKETTGTHT